MEENEHCQIWNNMEYKVTEYQSSGNLNRTKKHAISETKKKGKVMFCVNQ